jgi:hypothetical protein
VDGSSAIWFGAPNFEVFAVTGDGLELVVAVESTATVVGCEGRARSRRTARQFGVSWSTVWAAVERVGRARLEDRERIGPSALVGFDETVVQPAHC